MKSQWLGVEIRHLVALSAVAREGSFRGAADELGYVQSAISQQISQLERLIGCRLLERSRGMRGCSPTPAGEILLDHIEQIVARYRAAQADMAALEDGANGVLQIGMAGSVATLLLPELIRRMADLAPGIRLAPTAANSELDLFELVAGGELDVAFGMLPLEPGPFEACELAVEPLVLIVPAESPLARAAEPPTVDELAGLPLIGLRSARPETGVSTWLLALGVSPTVVHEVESEALAQALVAAGLGVAILPRFAVNLHDQRTVAVSLGEDAPARRLAVYWHCERRPVRALQEFCSAATSAARGLVGGCEPSSSTSTPLSLARAA